MSPRKVRREASKWTQALNVESDLGKSFPFVPSVSSTFQGLAMAAGGFRSQIIRKVRGTERPNRTKDWQKLVLAKAQF